MSDAFAAMSHPLRRQVLRMLRDGPLRAGDLAARFPVSKPTMSGHFAVLKEAGLIDAERDGTTIYYRLNVSVAEEAAAWLLDLTQGRARPAPKKAARNIEGGKA